MYACTILGNKQQYLLYFTTFKLNFNLLKMQYGDFELEFSNHYFYYWPSSQRHY